MKFCGWLDHGKCTLGLHGGKPLPVNCAACIKAGENNEAYAARLDESRKRAWPDGKPRVSGCCDSALNP